MDILPSYSEATSRQDWLSLVAPYVSASRWACCCLVDRRFYHHFAPRLWRDPLAVVRQLGLHPNDDLVWYRRFIQKHAGPARLRTRCMVKSLDFRSFALRASGLYSTEASERAISESFKALPGLFPELSCLLVDGHPELDPGSLATAKAVASHSLELLDLAGCRQELTAGLFCPPLFRGLVYLDVSYIPGSLRSAIQSSINPTHLPELRVLKARGREVDDATAAFLFQTFRLQLWSIDLSSNKLSDDAIDALLASCFSSLSFRSDAHAEVEGEVVLPKNLGTRQYGPFEFIQESSYSVSFTHPERYIADPPAYSRSADRTELRGWQTTRSDAIGPPRRDDADAAKAALLGDDSPWADKTPRQPAQSLRLPRGGITHLYLNGNGFTATGIGRLLRVSSGRLEHFECDYCAHTLPASSSDEGWQRRRRRRRRLRVCGMFGLSHLFRPAFSSNLRALRVHHSLVTQVPDVIVAAAADGGGGGGGGGGGLSPATALRLSETVLRGNVGRAYPLRFVPDMNPRVASLALTNVPARSSGAVIERLTSFLDLATLQRAAIRRAATTAAARRHGAVLGGLRHLRLELDPDFDDDDDDVLGSSAGRDVDYDRLLDPGYEDFGSGGSGGGGTFSFFDDDYDNDNDHAGRDAPSRPRAARGPEPRDLEGYRSWTSGRLKGAPYADTESQFVSCRVEASASWTGNVCSVPVWIGPGTIGSRAAVNEYMWNLQDEGLRTSVGPATPDHVAAGVPPLAYVFHAAWDAMVYPEDLAAAVARSGGGGGGSGPEPLRDVATAIKEYRARTRGTPRHWDGKIELVRASGASRYHASEYWR
ncbi:putative leucine rich repeat domain-containing protein [Rosellinia necatrix]|uniref:Putative leucine rich repeat domain-containing protein n=1 Tax=Rosellinia necatrix TaxID=77044 RepID=A0A1S7UMI1_ROSNE|nr:putative leucine rich repeat domain-containing protein [Rosellinia necatrix]